MFIAKKPINMDLGKLSKGAKAQIIGLSEQDPVIAAKLREIGFAEGDEVEIMHFGPFGGTPICIRLNGTLIALRRKEAGAIQVLISEMVKA